MQQDLQSIERRTIAKISWRLLPLVAVAIVGWIRDSTGSFEAGLYFLASLACALIAFIAARAAGAPAATMRASAAAAAQ